MGERLAEIKARWAPVEPAESWQRRRDYAWLIAEIGRLRGRLAELEWVGGNVVDGLSDTCPVCGTIQEAGHDNECWLAKELNVGRGE